jgi:hypothetical protein
VPLNRLEGGPLLELLPDRLLALDAVPQDSPQHERFFLGQPLRRDDGPEQAITAPKRVLALVLGLAVTDL